MNAILKCASEGDIQSVKDYLEENSNTALMESIFNVAVKNNQIEIAKFMLNLDYEFDHDLIEDHILKTCPQEDGVPDFVDMVRLLANYVYIDSISVSMIKNHPEISKIIVEECGAVFHHVLMSEKEIQELYEDYGDSEEDIDWIKSTYNFLDILPEGWLDYLKDHNAYKEISLEEFHAGIRNV
jgi:hypothetical protein